MTKVMNKKLKRIKEHPSQENLEQVKEFKNQEEFKAQEESLQTRIKIQDLENQDQDSRLKRFKISRIMKIKIQDSRFKNKEKTQSR